MRVSFQARSGALPLFVGRTNLSEDLLALCRDRSHEAESDSALRLKLCDLLGAASEAFI